MSRKPIVSYLIHLRNVPCLQFFKLTIIDMKKTEGKKQLAFFEDSLGI